MSSIFTKIINKQISCFKIAENNYCIALLDIFPLKKGHTLVISKLEIDILFDLPQKNYLELMKFTYIIAKAIKKTIPCKRIGLSVLGMEIPHAHIHLVPLNTENDLNFNNKKIQLSNQEMKEISIKISKNL